jgi:hypothetical protein
VERWQTVSSDPIQNQLVFTHAAGVGSFMKVEPGHQVTGFVQNGSGMLENLPSHLGAGQSAF